MKKDTIHFIITGGTIDSYYKGSADTAIPNKESVIPSFIENLKLYSKAKFTVICMKDSRDLTKNDIKKILKAVEASSYKKIIITHGTYTMPDTARFLKANLKNKNKTIILTGSLIPINGFSPSDGPFSLGYAIAKLDHLEPGVYVTMNGKVFAPEEIMKELSTAKFSSIFQK